jgi:protein-tyrosine phosphatase
MNKYKARFNDVITLVEQGENGHGSLYIGNLKAASSAKTLEKYNINTILTLCPDEPKAIEDHKTVSSHLYYPIYDHPSQQINFDYFERLSNVITEDLANGYNVLVHCYAGRSRSATFILFYQMTLEKYNTNSLKELLYELHEIHPLTAPNTGFVKQLVNWEKNDRVNANDIVSEPIEEVANVPLDDSSDPTTRQVQGLGSMEDLFPIRQENLEDFYRFKPSYMQDNRNPGLYKEQDEYDGWLKKNNGLVSVSKDSSHGPRTINYIDGEVNIHPDHHQNLDSVTPVTSDEIEGVYEDADPRIDGY